MRGFVETIVGGWFEMRPRGSTRGGRAAACGMLAAVVLVVGAPAVGVADVPEEDDGSAPARPARHELTGVVGLTGGKLQTHDEEAWAPGMQVGGNLHLGRNGAVTTRFAWVQPTRWGDTAEYLQLATDPFFALSLGIRAQAPVGRSLLAAGLALEMLGRAPWVGPPAPGAALTASWEYSLGRDWSLGAEFRLRGPLLGDQRMAVTLGHDF